jgi:hypothetical protein
MMDVKQHGEASRAQVLLLCDDLRRQIDETQTRLFAAIDQSVQVKKKKSFLLLQFRNTHTNLSLCICVRVQTPFHSILFAEVNEL